MRHAIIVAKLKLTNDVRQAVKEFQRFSTVIAIFYHHHLRVEILAHEREAFPCRKTFLS